MKKVIVTQKPGAEVPTEIIASSIKNISDGVRKIQGGRLNRKALLILLSHASGCSQKDCDAVVNAMGRLENIYLNPAAK